MSDTRERMQEVARAVQVILPPGTGFVVLGFDFEKEGEPPSGRLDYVSNAQRADICRMMINFIGRSANNFGQHELEKLLTCHVEIDEGERQATLLALAELALRRPGWNDMLTEAAKKFGGLEMFEQFKVTSASQVEFMPEPVRKLLEAASHALRSYQCGNAATDLAKDVADKIDERLLAS